VAVCVGSFDVDVDVDVDVSGSIDCPVDGEVGCRSADAGSVQIRLSSFPWSRCSRPGRDKREAWVLAACGRAVSEGEGERRKSGRVQGVQATVTVVL